MQKVSLFIPCAVDFMLVSVGKSLARILARLGFPLIYHENQTCCGQPAIGAGYVEEAKAAAKHFIRVFEKDEVIVGPSGSCIHTIRHEYPGILADEPEWQRRAEELGKRVYEFSQFLVDVAKKEDLEAHYSGKVAYHHSCHVLRGLGVEKQPLALLSKVRDAELLPLKGDKSCCGFGGQFALKYPEISASIVADKAKSFVDSGADTLILSDPGCLLNIRGYMQKHHPEREVLHLVEFLDSCMA